MAARDDAEARVRAQYEDYPYPARDPADEARRLVIGSPSHLAEIVHYLFAGRAPYGPGRRFRALIAGGGTGDAAIMLAQQLADAGAAAEVVHLDVSRSAARVARARARARGLDSISFVEGSLLDLDALGLGGFDYIDCCGVLHHLADPAAGLRALAAALAPGGGIGLMVYGALGRTGVYHVQEALKLLGDADAPAAARIVQARALLADLPETNWLRRNRFVADHLHGDDAGLHDLLLHARDRAYTVPELFTLCADAGVGIAALIEPARYDPASYLHDGELLARAAAMPWATRAALAELLSGAVKRHVAYVAPGRADGRVAAPDTADVVPVLRDGDGPALARALAAGGKLTAELENLTLGYSFAPLAPAMLARIDGARSLAEIHAALTTATDWHAFKAAFDDLYAKLNGINLLLLRRP